MKSCLWCSKFNNVVIACCQCLVPCRARDFVGKLFLHFSNACPTTFLRLKCSDKQCHVLHTRDIRNNLNRIIICKNYSRWASDPFFSWNLSAQRLSVGLINPLWQPTTQTQKSTCCFTGFHGLITFFSPVNYGCLKDWVFALFWSNFQDTGLVRVFHTGKCWSPHVFTIPGA